MNTLVAMLRSAAFGLLIILVIYTMFLLLGNWAFADEVVGTREAQLGEQNRSVTTYEAREASESVDRWHNQLPSRVPPPPGYEDTAWDVAWLNEYRYQGAGDEAGVKFCTHTDISVAAVLWELMSHPELIPVVETALQEYYNAHPTRRSVRTSGRDTDASTNDHTPNAGGDDTLPPT